MCVELIAPRVELEAYYRTHGAALRGKVIIYKHLEDWDIVDHALVTENIARPLPTVKSA